MPREKGKKKSTAHQCGGPPEEKKELCVSNAHRGRREGGMQGTQGNKHITEGDKETGRKEGEKDSRAYTKKKRGVENEIFTGRGRTLKKGPEQESSEGKRRATTERNWDGRRGRERGLFPLFTPSVFCCKTL